MNVINELKEGKIGVIATDTLYGIHGLALNKKVVKRIYKTRDRDPKKPFIILISSVDDLKLFKINIDNKTKDFLENIWPNKVSVILPCSEKELKYLSRGTKSLAFRIPKKMSLLKILRGTGPLISTSVNPEGKEPAYTIDQAKKYFGEKLDFYIDEGEVKSEPSTLIKINKKLKIEIVRQGNVTIKICAPPRLSFLFTHLKSPYKNPKKENTP